MRLTKSKEVFATHNNKVTKTVAIAILYVNFTYVLNAQLLVGGILFGLSLGNVFAFAFVVGSLAAVYLISSAALAQEEPIEGAGALVKAGESGVEAAPEMPENEEKKEDKDLAMTASYYGYALAGLPTASGETFDPEKHTAAHRSLPLGTELLVKRDGESVRVTVNDRGPYVAGRDLDLSQGAAEEIGLIGPGEDQVEVVKL